MRKTLFPNTLWLSIAAALGLLLTLGGVALAHAKLVKSEPAADSTVTTAPQTVTIWFSEEIDTKLSNIKVQSPDGSTADLGNSKVNLDDRKQMTAGLKQPLANGVYTVNWHAITPDDGGIADGRFKFTLAASGQAAPAPAATTPAQSVPTAAPVQATASSSPVTAPASPAPAAAAGGIDPAAILIIGSIVLVAAGAVLLLRRK